MRRVTIITSVLNLRLRQIVKSDGGYQNSLLHICRCLPNRPDEENTTLCTMFSNFFVDKVCALKRAIAAEVATLSTPFPTNAQFVGEVFNAIPTVTVSEVTKIITSISAKSSLLDFVATSVIKSCVTVFADLIARLANLSFSQGVFLRKYKFAIVTQLLKKKLL